eukprot:12404833-Karenia_brevis.AAC.1
MLRWILGAGRQIQAPPNAEMNEESASSDTSSSSTTETEKDDEDELTHLEPWIDWIRRTTHLAEGSLKRAGLEDWVRAVRRKQWRWAGHLARRTDGRWSTKVLSWTPTDGYRHQGHP